MKKDKNFFAFKSFLSMRSIRKTNLVNLVVQALRFGIVGLASNVLLYMLYLMLVNLGVDSKIVVTVLYVIGLSITFFFNKRWSFSHQGEWDISIKRYLLLYGCLYLTNIAVLWLFVDLLALSPAIIQAFVVLSFIPVVFLVQRYWVFPQGTRYGL
ncbi:GtrA family protein [Thiocapsa sp.]|uniref:GtrA family protein n=1 Tax=Thiocapsa sp. TaxID=2024551 RepID=UPI00345BD722